MHGADCIGHDHRARGIDEGESDGCTGGAGLWAST